MCMPLVRAAVQSSQSANGRLWFCRTENSCQTDAALKGPRDQFADKQLSQFSRVDVIFADWPIQLSGQICQMVSVLGSNDMKSRLETDSI